MYCQFQTVEVELVDAKKVEHSVAVPLPDTDGVKGCKPDRMTRPAADQGMSKTTWRDFKSQGKCYKRFTKSAGQDAIDQLIQPMTADDRRDRR